MNTLILWAASLVIVVANGSTALFGSSGPFPLMNRTLTTAIADLLPVISGLLAVFFLWKPCALLRSWDSTKICWSMLLTAIAFSTMGEITFGIMEALMGMEMGDYSLADVFWIPGYSMLLAAMLIMLQSFRKSGFDPGRKSVYLSLFGLFCTIASVVTVLLVAPIISDTTVRGLGKLVLSSYPLIDLLLLPTAMAIAYITNQFGGGAVSRPWRFISVGVLLWSVSDISYSYMEWIDIYSSGSFIDLGWNLSYLFIAAGAVQQQHLLASLNKGGLHA